MIDLKIGPNNWSSDSIVIQNTIIDHFNAIYKTTNPELIDDIDNLFPDKIADQDSILFCEIPSDVEIFSTIKQIPFGKALGLDGSTSFFLQTLLTNH